MRNAMMIGERVYLRPLEPDDADALASYDAAETETFFDEGRQLVSPISLKRWISGMSKHRPPQEIFFAVCLKEDDRLLGHVGVDGLDWVNRTGETGSYLGPAENRGKGYGTEAKHLLIAYCFEHLQLEMLHSYVWEPNTRSAAALLKQGYQPAGRVRHASTRRGKYHDMLVFDLSPEDWRAARERSKVAADGKRAAP